MAAKGRMNTLTSRVATPGGQNWLDGCAFTSRHRAVARRSVPLIPEVENTVPPLIQAARERVIFPMIDRALEPVTKPLPPAREIRPLPEIAAPAPITEAENFPPAPKIHQLSDPVRAELHSFRELSSAFLCPETSLDALPEYILFGLIVLLAVAWPILAMLGVMARN
jgi:hypothetical protein